MKGTPALGHFPQDTQLWCNHEKKQSHRADQETSSIHRVYYVKAIKVTEKQTEQNRNNKEQCSNKNSKIKHENQEYMPQTGGNTGDKTSNCILACYL